MCCDEFTLFIQWQSPTVVCQRVNHNGGILAGFNDLSAAEVNAEVDNALNTAIPGAPTADSINERIAAIDDLTQAAGGGDLAAILADTNELQADDYPTSIAAVQTAVDGIQTDLDNGTDGLGALKTLLDALPTLAEVLGAEITENTVVPAASPTLEEALSLLYMALRNKVDVTATTKEVHNDAGTVLGTKTLSDNGTTYSETKMA